MLVIAITGGIASGKSTAANIFHNNFNIPIIDTDIIAKAIVKPGTELLHKISDRFGSTILNNDKSLNRRKLRELIFNNPEDKKWLENLLHPAISQEVHNQIEKLKNNSNHKYCLILIPLLTKQYLKSNQYINKVIVVNSSPELQLARASQRDNQSTSEIEKIISSQLSSQQRLELADYVIENNSDINNLSQQVSSLHHEILFNN